MSARPRYGDVPLDVSFNSSGSNDPGGGHGDKLPLELRRRLSQRSRATNSSANHAYAGSGTVTYTATNRCRQEQREEYRQRSVWTPETALPPTRQSHPLRNQLFKVGEKIVLRGSATNRRTASWQTTRLARQVVQQGAHAPGSPAYAWQRRRDRGGYPGGYPLHRSRRELPGDSVGQPRTPMDFPGTGRTLTR